MFLSLSLQEISSLSKSFINGESSLFMNTTYFAWEEKVLRALIRAEDRF